MSKRNAEVVELLLNHPDTRLNAGGWVAYVDVLQR